MAFSLRSFLLDIFFPKKCFNCKKEGEYICEKCNLFLSEVPNIKLGEFEELISGWEYNGIAKKSIEIAKERNMFDVFPSLTDKIISTREIFFPKDLTITYVPQKKAEKEVYPALLIAEYLAKKTSKKLVSLLEAESFKKQKGLNKKERFENVKGKFKFKEVIVPTEVLLVDDFLESGATMTECCKVLKEKGVKKVWGFTIARLN